MTSSIQIGKYKNVPIYSCTWLNSLNAYTNRAEIVVPGLVNLREHDYSDKNSLDARIPTSQIFTIGLAVIINAGYDKKDDLRFMGFIASSNLKGKRLVINCEGYSYPLRNVVFSKSYLTVSLKNLLKDLLTETPIKLSPFLQEIELSKLAFKKQSGTDVLDYLVKKCGLTVFFDNDKLYVGLRYTQTTNEDGKEKIPVKFRIDWNIIDSDTLVFKEVSENQVSIITSKPDGTKNIITTGEGEKREIRIRHLKNDEFLRKLLDDINKRTLAGSYSGAFTAFAEPFVKPTDVVELADTNYKIRTGRYFVTEVEGSLSTSGMRQEIKIDIKLADIDNQI